MSYASTEYVAYLQSDAWKVNRRRAFFIWRCLGWAFAVGPLLLHVFGAQLPGYGAVLTSRTLLLVSLFALLYACSINLVASLLHYHRNREGHHWLGYHRLTHESWVEIMPVSPGVNHGEKLLRHLLPGASSVAYAVRTLVAIVICRMWWVWGGWAVASWIWGPGAVRVFVGQVAGRI